MDSTFTDTYDPPSAFVPPPGATYISGESEEERSHHTEAFRDTARDVQFVEITSQDVAGFTAVAESAPVEYRLRSHADLERFWSRIGEGPIFLDITGLDHPTWAGLVAAALRLRRKFKAIYVEPTKYRFNPIRTEGELFDLTLEFAGIAPLPGFASLEPPDDQQTLFIPLLGFEGPRFARMIEEVQVRRESIFPVVGVPGFRPEFVFFAYHGNRLPLQSSESWKRVRFATANCPFSLFHLLERLAHENPGMFMRIAPIGTKPHGLAAILFALANEDRVEILYDHPTRRRGRTEGTSRLLLYHLEGIWSKLSQST